MLHLEQIEPVARTIVVALGVGILESALLALVVWAMTLLRPRPSATTRHVLWWLTLAASVVLPLVSIAASLGRIQHNVVEVRVPAAVSTRVAKAPASSATARVLRAERTAAQPTAPQPAQPQPAGPLAAARSMFSQLAARSLAPMRYAGTALLALWLVLATLGVAGIARGAYALRRLKHRALPLDESVVRRLRRWRLSARAGRKVALAVSNEVDVPVAVGFRTPTILLPIRVVETEDVSDLDQIAMHEYAHLDRLDDWTNLVQRAIERIFWFNPIVLFVGRRISLEREIACDDWVIAQTGRAHRYATCLWKLVESSRLPTAPILAPGALLTPRQITARIEALLDAHRNALPRLSPFGALGMVALCIVAIVVQVQRAPVIALTEEHVVAAPAVAAKPVAHPATVTHAAAASVQQTVPETHVVTQTNPEPQMPVAPQVHAAPQTHAVPGAHAVPEVHAVAKARIALAPHQPAFDVADAQQWAKFGTNVAQSVLSAVRTQAGTPGGTPNGDAASSMVRSAIAMADGDASKAGSNGLSVRELLLRCTGCDLSHEDLRGVDLSGISLTGDDLRGVDLRGANLSSAKLTGLDLSDANLEGADLRNAVLSGCDMRNLKLKGARLDGVRLVGVSLRDFSFEGQDVRSLIGSCQGCDLRGVNLRGRDLHGVHVVGADLHGADLRDANLDGASFNGADLGDANLAGANLHGVRFVGCDMHGVDFRGANLDGVELNGSRP